MAEVDLGTGKPLAYEIIKMGATGIDAHHISQQSRMYLNRTVKESDNIPDAEREHAQTHHADGVKEKLGEWLATGICGNNITSSALYVVALCSVPAGKYAPIALACIAILLYLFRRIYEEVVTALPVNGGTYNLLLNTTTKAGASVAACLTMLSYVTTAVISATSAMNYIHTLCDGGCVAVGPDTTTSVIVTTLITLAFAAFLNIMGITESAVVALVIFLFHMLSMVVLVIASLAKAASDMPTVLVDTASGLAVGAGAGGASAAAAVFDFALGADALPLDASACTCLNGTAAALAANATAAAAAAAVDGLEDVPMLVYNWVYTNPSMGIGGAIFFGYSSALLGISGFESSSNYVENQKPGVFPKTLRNMWVAVTFINPSVALLAQCLLPVDSIAGQAEEGALLSIMAQRAAGDWLKIWIVIDATLVLVGAVITAFVGFTGLSHRMTVDRCLPQIFLTVNQLRNTRHYIIGFFWLLTSLLVVYTWGNVEIMAGVYTVAFLSVMFSFTVGNMLLKLRRSTLPTPVHVEWSIVILASLCVLSGLVGNIISRPRSLPSLLIFGTVFIVPVQLMLNRVKVLSIIQAITVGQPVDSSYFSSPRMGPQPDPVAGGFGGGGHGGGGGGRTDFAPMNSLSLLDSQVGSNPRGSVRVMSREDSGGAGKRGRSPSPGAGKGDESPGGSSGKQRRGSNLLKKSISDASRLDRLFYDAVKSVRELLDSDRATLWLIDHKNGVLWSKVAEGIPHIRVPLDKGIVGWVCTHSQTLNIPDAYKDDRFNPAVDKKTGESSGCSCNCVVVLHFTPSMSDLCCLLPGFFFGSLFCRLPYVYHPVRAHPGA